MDPYEVGTKILAGMTEQEGLILTHPEHGPDFEEIHAAVMAALPVEDAPRRPPQDRAAAPRRR